MNLNAPSTTTNALACVVSVREEGDLDWAGIVKEADDELVGGGGGAGHYVFQDTKKCRELFTRSRRQRGEE